jgi:glycosyltransferase involved in cell wall biosynthesis
MVRRPRVNPFFSVVIATRDRCDVDNAVRSVLRQTDQDFEIIVVDDQSMVPVSSMYDWNHDARVRIVRSEKNLGPSGARNLGIIESRGDFVAFLDDDDLFVSIKLARVHDVLRNNPRTDVVYHRAKIRMVRECHSYETNPVSFVDVRELYRELLIRNIVGGLPMVIVRRTVCIAIGGFDTALRSRVDYDFVVRLAQRGSCFAFVDQALSICNYTTGRKSVSKSISNLIDGHAFINRKYASDMANLLTPGELRAQRAEIASSAGHAALLNYDIRAVVWFLRAFVAHPRVRYVIAAFVSAIWPRLLFLVR